MASLACALAVPGAAYADSLTTQINHLRGEVVAAFGKRAPGRNILRWGIAKPNGTARPATDAELLAYRDTLARMLAPAVPAPSTISSPVTPAPGAASATVDSSASTVVAATAASSGSGDLPTCTWAPESGGDWSAVNPSTGAGGYYQITPSTWAANGGTGLPQDASPAEQTQVAENIMRSQGPSAWTNC